MDKAEFEKLNEDFNRDGSNSQKVAAALGSAVRYVLTPPEKGEPDLAMFVEVFTNGLVALRAQIISETLLLISDQGRAFSVPNNAEDLKASLAMSTMLANQYADATIMTFMKKAEEASKGMIKTELVDKGDPRVTPTPPSAPQGSTVH
jgi:hypothetical protein